MQFIYNSSELWMGSCRNLTAILYTIQSDASFPSGTFLSTSLELMNLFHSYSLLINNWRSHIQYGGSSPWPPGVFSLQHWNWREARRVTKLGWNHAVLPILVRYTMSGKFSLQCCQLQSYNFHLHTLYMLIQTFININTFVSFFFLFHFS